MAEEGSPYSRSMVIGEILRYLVEHPDAKDTIEGILRWWFPKGGLEREQDVQHAIDELVSKGWVVKRGTTPSQAVYGMDKNHLEDIKNFLMKGGDK